MVDVAAAGEDMVDDPAASIKTTEFACSRFLGEYTDLPASGTGRHRHQPCTTHPADATIPPTRYDAYGSGTTTSVIATTSAAVAAITATGRRFARANRSAVA